MDLLKFRERARSAPTRSMRRLYKLMEMREWMRLSKKTRRSAPTSQSNPMNMSRKRRESFMVLHDRIEPFIATDPQQGKAIDDGHGREEGLLRADPIFTPIDRGLARASKRRKGAGRRTPSSEVSADSFPDPLQESVRLSGMVETCTWMMSHGDPEDKESAKEIMRSRMREYNVIYI